MKTKECVTIKLPPIIKDSCESRTLYVFILSMQIRFTVTVPFQIRIKLINTETVGRTWDSL